jgi:hyperosmotically inducible protein
MRSRASSKLMPALVLVLAAAGPVLAQSASESMHEAGHSAGNAISHAWQGTKTATKDTDITAKVKLKLHDDKITKEADIHVKTVDGVVTLRGSASSEAAAHAEQLTRETEGVRGVRNRVKVTD